MKITSVNSVTCWNPDGTRSIERLKELFVDIHQRKLIETHQPPAPRAVFRKQHGIATGMFNLLQLPKELKHLENDDLGIFNYDRSDEKKNSFECILRFSSDVSPSAADLNSTIGIGMKLFGKEIKTDFFSSPNIDFIFQNIDKFFVPDAEQMCQFTTASILDKDIDSFLNDHPKTKKILDEMDHGEGSCLTTDYWSIIPFRFGSNYMVKYRLKPVVSEKAHPVYDENFLAKDLHSRLLNDDYKFLFEIQVKEFDASAGEDLQHPWTEPFIPVAELILPKQDTNERGLAEFGDYLNFNIWRVPSQNFPFGSLAEARREVYKYSAETRYRANGWEMREPLAAPCPYSTNISSKDDCIVKAAIYPSIGVMRVGNSEEIYIGPLIPDPQPNDDSFYRDRYGRLKRQAAEFRIYGLNAKGEAVKELTYLPEEEIHISWSCHLANQKAAWYNFSIALDVPEAKDYPACNQRNMNIKDRASLVIDGGKKVIDCAAKNEKKAQNKYDAILMETFEGRFMEHTVYLGDMFIKNESNRLYLAGGKGEAKNIKGEIAITFANNEGWYDDISDGPVTASVKYKGKELEVDPAWIICAPPDYAPMQKSVRTIWDLMRDLAVSRKMLPCPERPSLKEDILPIFQRMTDLQWVNKGFADMFGHLGPFNFNNREWIDKLTDNSTKNLEFRRLLYNQFRQFDLPGSQSPALWPWLYGDSIELPATNSPRQHSTLTPLQLKLLKQWMDGDFVNDLLLKESFQSIDQYPVKEQPGLLTKAALDFCLADAFHPGCEMTWPVRMSSMYSAPFRFRHDENGSIEDHLCYGASIDHTIISAEKNPFGKQVAGNITRWMAIPWQTDTSSCRDGYDTDYDPYLPTFWPARVPNNIVGFGQFKRLTDDKLSPEEKMSEFQYRKEWLEDLPGHPTRYDDYKQVINTMVTHFDRAGIVLQQQLDVSGLPDKIQVAHPKTTEHLSNVIHDFLEQNTGLNIPVALIQNIITELLKEDTNKIGDITDYVTELLSQENHKKKPELLTAKEQLNKNLIAVIKYNNTDRQKEIIKDAIKEHIIQSVEKLPKKTYVKPGEKTVTIHEHFRQQFRSLHSE